MVPVLLLAKAPLKSSGTRLALHVCDGEVHRDALCLCRARRDLRIVGRGPTYEV